MAASPQGLLAFAGFQVAAKRVYTLLLSTNGNESGELSFPNPTFLKKNTASSGRVQKNESFQQYIGLRVDFFRHIVYIATCQLSYRLRTFLFLYQSLLNLFPF